MIGAGVHKLHVIGIPIIHGALDREAEASATCAARQGTPCARQARASLMILRRNKFLTPAQPKRHSHFLFPITAT